MLSNAASCGFHVRLKEVDQLGCVGVDVYLDAEPVWYGKPQVLGLRVLDG